MAFNAQQVCGVQADLGQPMVWAMARRSALSKAAPVPAGLGLRSGARRLWPGRSGRLAH